MAPLRRLARALLVAEIGIFCTSGWAFGAEASAGSPLSVSVEQCPPGDAPTDRQGFVKLASCLAAGQGLPSEVAHAVIEIESNFKPGAIGRDGEIGLMQVLPSTARLMGFRGTNEDLADPATNMKYGVRYLSQAWALSNQDLCMTVMKYRAGHAETRFSYLSVEYCLRARAILKRAGIAITGSVPTATFGFANAGSTAGGSTGGACLRRSFVPGPGYGRCLSASSKVSQAKVVSLRRSIFGR